MKKLRGKGILQKIIMVLIILIIFNFIFPAYSRAAWWGGGTLFTPISEFICGVGDAVINTLQSYLLPGSPEAVAHKKLGDFLVEEQRKKVYAISDKKAQKILEFGSEIDAQEQAELDQLQAEFDKENKELADMVWANSSGNGSWFDMRANWIRWFGDKDGWFVEQDIVAIIYSPQAIFSNIVPALDVNFINPDVSYAGLGAGVGALVGGKTYDTASALGRGASDVKDTFQQGFYGSEYKDKILNPKLDKEYKHDKDVREHFRVQYGDKANEKMKIALQLRHYGITDQKEIDSAIKLMDKNSGLEVEQAAFMMDFKRDLNKSALLDAGKWNNIRASAKKMVGGSDEQADRIMRLLNQSYKLPNDHNFNS